MAEIVSFKKATIPLHPRQSAKWREALSINAGESHPDDTTFQDVVLRVDDGKVRLIHRYSGGVPVGIVVNRFDDILASVGPLAKAKFNQHANETPAKEVIAWYNEVTNGGQDFTIFNTKEQALSAEHHEVYMWEKVGDVEPEQYTEEYGRVYYVFRTCALGQSVTRSVLDHIEEEMQEGFFESGNPGGFAILPKGQTLKHAREFVIKTDQVLAKQAVEDEVDPQNATFFIIIDEQIDLNKWAEAWASMPIGSFVEFVDEEMGQRVEVYHKSLDEYVQYKV
jgi:hypothetical protein